MDIAKAIENRSSIRCYLNKNIKTSIIEQILKTAAHSPSGANIQPWHVAVVQGNTKTQLSNALTEARKHKRPENPDYQYYPINWFEPYKTRRVECGMALYQALGIARDDHEKRLSQWYKNYNFFGAPVGLCFFLHKALDKGSWLDMGMFIQSVMLAALSHQLGTCPQASIAEYPDIVREVLDISDDYLLVCGMSLGYPDLTAAENQYRLPRVKIDEFAKWYS